MFTLVCWTRKEHSEKVVLHLLKDKLNLGHHAYINNFHNSFEFAKTLIEHGVHCTGILQSNRQTKPVEVATAKLKKCKTTARYSNGIMNRKRKDKRDVLYFQCTRKYDDNGNKTF